MGEVPAAPVRVDPRPAAGELETLLGFLRWQRVTLLRKVEGLTAEQLRSAPTVSALTLAGLLKHLAYVEESWIVQRFRGLPATEPWASADWDGDRDWEFHSAAGDDPAWLVARYRQAWTVVDDALSGAGPDDLSVGEVGIDADDGRGGVRTDRQRVSLRWILTHLVEETARHNGQADLLREALDGATGE